MTTDRRDPSEALTCTEAARRLGVNPRTVKRMAPADLPYFTVGARHDRRYRPHDLERYVESRTFRL